MPLVTRPFVKLFILVYKNIIMSIFDKVVSEIHKAAPVSTYNPNVRVDLPNLNLAINNANYASEFHRRLCEYIIDFEESLQEDEEIAIKLVSFGETIIVYIEDIGYNNPSLISFVGSLSTGERVNLIQHVTQLSFLLIATKTIKPQDERRRIGYKLRHELEAEANAKENTSN